MRGRPRCALLLLVAVSLAAALPVSSAAEWVLDTQLGVQYEDNVSHGATEPEQKSDVAFVPLLSLGHYFQLSDSTGLLTTADVRGSLFTRFSGLDNYWAGVSGRLRYKFGLGAQAPWAQVIGTAGYQGYREDIRSGVSALAGVRVGKRLHERVDLYLGYVYDVTEAREPVFSIDGHTLSTRGTVSVTPGLDLALEFGARWGTVVVDRAPGAGPFPSPSLLVTTFDTPLVATRIDALTYIVAVDLSYAFTRHASGSVGYSLWYARGKVDYPDNIIRAQFVYSF